jgi:hypothetical protein
MDHKMKNNFNDLGLEAIHFQKERALHRAITAHMDVIRGCSEVTMMLHQLNQMEKTIYKLTGMTVKVYTHDDPAHDNMMVIYESLGHTHPLMSKMSAAMAANSDSTFKILDPSRTLRGGVDLKTGMVYGDYSKVVSSIYISTKMLNIADMSSAELSAFFIHELGHIHTYFEFLAQTFITNYLLHEAARIWMGNYPKEKRIEVLAGIEQQNKVKIANKEELANADDPNVVYAIINNSSINKVRSEMGTAFYDRRNVEFLADQFSNRHGAGRDLITSQDKFNRARPWIIRDSAFRSTSSMVVANLIKVSMTLTANTPALIGVRALVIGTRGAEVAAKVGLGATILSTALVSTPELAVNVVMGAGSTWLMGLFSDNGNHMYDKPADRFAAVRNDLVSALKVKNLDKSYAEGIIEDLAVIDATIEKLNGLGMLDKMLFDFIIESFSGHGNEVKLQQQYEKLSNNNLFQHAAKLSTLGAK